MLRPLYAIVLAAALRPAFCSATVIYVDATAPPGGDGQSWPAAYQSLQDAFATAAADPNITEIHVAQGTYRPAARTDPNDPRSATFTLLDGVAVRGGYAGLVAPDHDLRDPRVFTTTLSGDLAGDDGPGFANDGENSYHVVTAPAGVGLTAVLDSVRIAAGAANGPSSPGDCSGGGVYCLGSPTLMHCTFIGNLATYKGGGLYNSGGSPTLTNSTFVGNVTRGTGSYGGGLYTSAGNPTVRNCTFSSNAVSLYGSGPYGNGGGLYSEGGLVVTNSIVWGNSGGNVGGIATATYSDGWGSASGTGNTNADPRFLYSLQGLPRLGPGSPCIDAGDPNSLPDPNDTDSDGEPRVMDGNADDIAVVDMGADELNPDCNGNGVPDSEDIGLGTSSDCNSNGWPDECDLAFGNALDADYDGILDGCEATILYVDASAPAGGDGTRWPVAYRFLKDALKFAALDPNITEIHVAHGTYLPDHAAASPGGTGNRSASFAMRSGLALNGGYAGLGAADPDSRDPNTYVSILSGDLAGDDGPDFANNADNSLHVVLASSTDATAVLDGFTITGGNADGSQAPDDAGGGLRCDLLYWTSIGHPTVSHCAFRGNWGRYSGGVDAAGTTNGAVVMSHPTFSHCAFDKNRAAVGGGALSLWESTATVIDCTFTDNSSLQNGGALRVGKFPGAASGPLVQNCLFRGNHATQAGGAVYMGAGYTPTLRIYACSLERNSAGYYGGAAYFESAPLYAWNCLFNGNAAGRIGGAVVAPGGSLFATNCLFAGNSATSSIGGLYLSGGALRNCTIVNNIAPASPGGLRATAGDVSNCILWGNVPDQIDPNSTPSVRYSDVEGGWLGTANIDADPLFVDPDGLDSDPNTWADNDYRLSSGSPCIDAGNNLLVARDALDLDADGCHSDLFPIDLDGHTRVVDDPPTPDTGVATPGWVTGVVDMGAYEFGAPLPGAPSDPCPGDTNCDGRVTFADIDPFVEALAGESAWNQHHPDCPWLNADCNGDGRVTFGDIDPFVALIGL